MLELLGRQGAGGLQHRVGAGADAEVSGEIDPTDCAGGIDEEFGGAGDVVAVDTGAFVQHVVTADGFGVWIGEERIRVAGLAAEIEGRSGGIDADGNRLDA